MGDLLYLHWNVDPVLIHIGNWGLRWYSLLFVGGFIIGWYVFRWFIRREKVGPDSLVDTILYTMLLCVIVGARLGHCIFYQPEYYFGSWEGFLEVFQPWKGGLASHGGAIAMILGVWWFSAKYGKKHGFDFLWVMDRLVLIVCFAGAMIRIGNFFNSEIIGYNSTLPWAVVFERTRDFTPKHPTMLYEAACYIILGIVMMRLYLKKLDRMRRGEFLGIFLTFCFGCRFLLEFTKFPSRPLFDIGGVCINMGHMLSVPFIIAGITVWLVAHFRGKPASLGKSGK